MILYQTTVNLESSIPVFTCQTLTWSVMIMRLPYLSSSTDVYFLLCFNPRMVFMCWISILFWIWVMFASRTLRSFPRSGNTPYLSLPTTDRPPSTSALAESPSVRINVQCLLCPFTPAKLASSSLGTLIRLMQHVSIIHLTSNGCFLHNHLWILEPSALAICSDCLNSAHLMIFSTMPLLTTDRTLAALQSHVTYQYCLPFSRNLSWGLYSFVRLICDLLVIIVSFVCESKAGLGIRQFT